MSSIDLVDPEVRSAIALLSFADLKYENNLEQIREANAWSPSMLGDVRVEMRELHVPGPRDAPDVRMFAYRPRAASGPLPAVLHIHGGGFVVGLSAFDEIACHEAVVQLGCAVYSVDYRLPPEIPYPGPLEDCYAALRWIFSAAESEGVDPSRIGVRGLSAGGGLAAAMALLARDRGEFKLAFQHLNCPMLDDRTAARETEPHLGEFVWNSASNAFGWRCMIGGEPGGPDVPPYCAPARATDLSGLPAAYINVGSLDLFVEENIEYARRLAVAGVPVELHVYPGGYHGFELASAARISQASIRNQREALRRALYG